MSDLGRARELLARGRRIVAFSGAGLSAESGVPTFRDAQTGLWAKYDPMMLASPEGFARDPGTVIEWYNWRRRAIAAAVPNDAHRALAGRDDILNITQNVDDLLERAGVPTEKIVHLHGLIGRDRCNAAAVAGRCAFDEAIDLSDPPPLRSCPRCGDCLRPAVVWFGEPLPEDAWRSADLACRGCDTLLAVGTSAAVYPAAGLIHTARTSGAAVVVVNVEPTGSEAGDDLVLIDRAGSLLPRVLMDND